MFVSACLQVFSVIMVYSAQFIGINVGSGDRDTYLPDMDSHVCIPSDSMAVFGRLRRRANFWRESLRASEHIMSIVSDGYRLPFVRLPTPSFLENHSMSYDDRSFAAEAIKELVDNCCVGRVDRPPLVCSPLQVVHRDDGKRRLVIDLRYVNKHLHKFKFKYEGLDVAAQLLEKGSWFTVFDLKSGYHHVEIHSDSWQYLGFSWTQGEKRAYYEFRVLPFGLSTACYIFTKLLRPLVRRWRSSGLKLVLYIDDGICIADSESHAESNTAVVTQDLHQAGFILNSKKSILTPQMSGRWLGVNIDLHEGLFSIPGERVAKLRTRLERILSGSVVSARELAKVTGLVLSMMIAVGPVARLRTRAMYSMINSRVSWNRKMSISLDARDELEFWLQHIHLLNGRPFRWSPSATRVVYSDASDTGCGGYVVEFGPHVSHSSWSAGEARQSSTWRELKAVDRVLASFAERLEGHTVKWCTDNQNVARIVQAGSRKPYLQEGAMSIFERCLQHSIKLEMSWIPRSLNERADYISRIVDHDDWLINPCVFAWLNSLWGPFTVDNFADHVNAKLPIFHSKFWCPGTSAVDTFTTDWRDDMNWLVPPVVLIGRTLRHAKTCGAKGCLVVPKWHSAYFWPMICSDGVHLEGFIHAWCILQYENGLILSGRSGSSIAKAMNSESFLLALLIDFSVSCRFPVQHPAFQLP